MLYSLNKYYFMFTFSIFSFSNILDVNFIVYKIDEINEIIIINIIIIILVFYIRY